MGLTLAYSSALERSTEQCGEGAAELKASELKTSERDGHNPGQILGSSIVRIVAPWNTFPV